MLKNSLIPELHPNVWLLMFAQALIGQSNNVLFERRKGDYFLGHTSNYIPVRVKTTDDLKNQILPVHLSSFDNGLIGEILQ